MGKRVKKKDRNERLFAPDALEELQRNEIVNTDEWKALQAAIHTLTGENAGFYITPDEQDVLRLVILNNQPTDLAAKLSGLSEHHVRQLKETVLEKLKRLAHEELENL